MKKLILFSIILASLSGIAQIETSLRWVGIGPTGGLNFFLDDSTDLVTIDCDYNSAFAIFTDPTDSLLYGLIRGTGEAYGNQNLYIINPFTGDIDLVHDFSGTWFRSAAINTDGSIIYLLVGETPTIGNIIAYDTNTGIETLLTTAHGISGESTFGMEYHPIDDKLYIYEGSEIGSTLLQKIDVDILSNETSSLIGYDRTISGAMWQGIDYKFVVLTSYDCAFLRTTGDFPHNLEEFYTSCMPETTDITEIHTIYAQGDSIAICPTDDSTQLELMYDVNSFMWYKDGVELLTETNPILTITEPGVYQAAMEIKTTTAMLFSKEITVYIDPDCHSSLEQIESTSIKIYPNPVVNSLYVTAETAIEQVQVFDLDGRLIFNQENITSMNLSIDLSALESGIYIVEVLNTSGQYIQRIIK